MNKQLVEWLNKKFDCDISEDYYSYIDEWNDWWKGYHSSFHSHFFYNGRQNLRTRVFSLRMGKKVCEDWAGMLFNSKTHIKISDENTSRFIQGRRENGGVFGSNGFLVKGNGLVEKAFALGTAAVTVRLDGIRLTDGKIPPVSPEAKIRFSYLSADQIIPISVRNGIITEAAFASEHTEKGKKHLLLEIHLLNNKGNYTITNYMFSCDNDQLREEPLPADMIRDFDTGSDIPWFAMLSPNIENNIERSGGLGISILHNAIDALMSVDICFNNFTADFRLGQKKVFMEKDLVETDDNGNSIAPDDVHQQLFSYVKFPTGSGDEKKFIMEFNPSLRVDDNTKGIQSALDYLSFKCGLGNKHYQFNNGTVVTATQYTGDRQDLIQNADKHYLAVERFLLSLIHSVIYIGRNFIGADISDDPEIEICFDRSVVIDEAAERLQDLSEVQAGVKAPWEFRAKWYGESEDTAREAISEIQGETEVDLGFGSGDA